MSTYSEQDYLNPNDPAYYAPRWLRERSKLRLPRSSEPGSGRRRLLVPSPLAFDNLLEEAVPEALRRPLEPEVIDEPPEFERELDRQTALINVAGRFAAAIGVSALVALFFAIMVPASRDFARQPAGGASSFSGILQSITAFYQPTQRHDDKKPDASEIQTILASPRTSQAVITHEQSEALLQQFLQWRQKPGSTGAPQ
jgi:hypothetical protein